MKASSGYESAMDQLEAAERQLANCYLTAPFSFAWQIWIPRYMAVRQTNYAH